MGGLELGKNKSNSIEELGSKILYIDSNKIKLGYNLFNKNGKTRSNFSNELFNKMQVELDNELIREMKI